jgi:hypothetical protein
MAERTTAPWRWVLAPLALTLTSPAVAQEDASLIQDGSPEAAQPADPVDVEPARPDAETLDAGVEPPTPVLGDEVSFEIATGVRLVLLPPFDWTGTDASELAIPELAQVPDAEAVFKHTWKPERRRGQLTVLCATAPATEWASGMQSMVFERLNVVARSELGEGMTVATFSAGPVEDAPPLFRQSFDATGTAGGHRREGSIRVLEADPIDNNRDAVLGSGRHFLAFLAEPDRVLVCSAACVESVRWNRGRCSGSLASLRLDGQLAPEPSASTMGRFVLGIKRRPSALLGTALGLLFALVGVLVILRGLLIRTPSA